MRLCAGFLTVAASLIAAAPAQAGIRVSIKASGALTATWHGDPARGCAAAGVCDVAGSVTLAPEPGDRTSESSGGIGLLDLLGVTSEDAIVRVARGAPDRPAGVCLDSAGPTELRLGAARPSGGRVRVALVGDEFPLGGPLSAGRCAGPLPRDLARAFPITTVRTRDLRGPDVHLDLRGRRTFAAGGFAGEVVSTFVLRAHVTRTSARRPQERPAPVAPGGRSRRAVELTLRYRAVPSGALAGAFRAAPSPRCEALDACGLAGTFSLGLTRPLALRLDGTVPLPAGRRPSLAAALAAVRAGRGSLFLVQSGDGWPARQTAEVTRDGAPACRDARALELPELSGRTQGGHLELSLGARGQVEPEDPLRSRCAGPSRVPERDGALATGAVSRASIGARRLTVRLAARPSRDPDFAVTTREAPTLTLERTSASARAITVRSAG